MALNEGERQASVSRRVGRQLKHPPTFIQFAWRGRKCKTPYLPIFKPHMYVCPFTLEMKTHCDGRSAATMNRSYGEVSAMDFLTCKIHFRKSALSDFATQRFRPSTRTTLKGQLFPLETTHSTHPNH